MTVEDLVHRVCAAGVVLTPRLHVDAPAGAMPNELRAELAETLGWPRLPLDPPVTIVGGEAMWRIFLTKASVPELREQVLPKLQGIIASIPPPAGASES